MYTTKDLGDGGRSEEKRRCAVNSKWKSTKNLFLAGSFLTCWLAGPFCRNLLLSTNDLKDAAPRKGRGGILIWGVLGICFYYVQPINWGIGAGQRKKRRYAVNSKQKLTKNLFLVGSFLKCWLAGPFCQNLLLSTNDLNDMGDRKDRGEYYFGEWEFLFSVYNQRFGGMGAGQRRRGAVLSIQSKNRLKTCF